MEQSLKKLKYHSRNLPDSTLKLLYSKPPFCAYGQGCRSNTVLYDSHLKTFNVNPHLNQNPEFS